MNQFLTPALVVIALLVGRPLLAELRGIAAVGQPAPDNTPVPYPFTAVAVGLVALLVGVAVVLGTSTGYVVGQPGA